MRFTHTHREIERERETDKLLNFKRFEYVIELTKQNTAKMMLEGFQNPMATLIFSPLKIMLACNYAFGIHDICISLIFASIDRVP